MKQIPLPTKTYHGAIEIFENIWPNPQHTIDVIENECLNPDSGISWLKAGTVGSGAYQNIRTNSIMDLTYLSDITNNEVVQNINNIFYTTLLSTSNSYAKRFEGMVILFPSNYAYRHIAHPVTSGTKYAIVTWIKDRSL